ncbi:alpha/beta hydrolase fold domain-containing protein [Nocardia sp. R6R-6]|uniref:alpha/beta hydrolase fold domain-containing protein n=1 Tax=Nocardia sp. R6R-6 TaxID=3459303 RepID=UPI00403E06B0
MKAQPRKCDPTGYRTFLFPDRYEPDWRSFYISSYEQTLDLSVRTNSKMGILYGADPFQTLDIFAPPGVSDAPVLLFFHGGGFREGHPSHYGYLGEAFLERGAVFVSVGYRFEPDHGYPDYVADGALALKWVFDNVADCGGSADKLYVAGHSAGANISALLSFRGDWIKAADLPSDVIKGCGLISGGYDFTITDPLYPDQDERPAEASVVHDIQTTPERVVVAHGFPEAQRLGQSGDFFRNQAEALVHDLHEIGCRPDIVVLPDTDHLAMAQALGDKSSPLYAAMSRMLFP